MNGDLMAHVKRGRSGDELHGAFTRSIFINDNTFCLQHCWRAGWALPMLLCLSVRVSGLLHVVRIAFCRVVEYGRVNCA